LRNKPRHSLVYPELSAGIPLRFDSKLLPKSPVRAVVFFGVLVICVITGITALIIGEMLAREERAAQEQLLAFNTLLADQTARAIESVALVVESVVDDLRQAGIDTAERFDALRDDPAVHQQLRQRMANIPQMEAVTLDSVRGRLINMSRYLPVPDIDITDRDYYQFLVKNPNSLTTISAPVQNRGSGTWDIYLARRMNGPQGAFVGLVLGAMRLEYFEHLYDSISMAGNMRICLWRADGTLLARYPRSPLLGQHVSSRKPILAQTPGETVVRSNFAGSEGLMMIASQKLGQNGLVVEVSESMDAVLADWRHDALVVAISGAACIGAIVLLMLALIRQFRTYGTMAEAIAAREEAVAARQHAEQRLLEGQKMEAIGRVTSGIAHDFNNLLGSIMGNVELMQRDPVLTDTATRRLSVIEQAADRGAGLIRQLLAFSRQQVLAPSALQLDEILPAMFDLLEGTTGRHIRVAIVVEPGLWPVLVDPAQFEYMILNLAANARDAMRVGGTLTISACRVPLNYGRPEDLPAGDFVALSVSDTGSGMPADVMARAFDPFFTTKPPGRGSGLGLSQVYGLATQSGGLAQINSVPNKGTTITVYLPRAVDFVAKGTTRHPGLVEKIGPES